MRGRFVDIGFTNRKVVDMSRISYLSPDEVADEQIKAWLIQAIDDGKPGPEFQAIRAQVPGVIRSFVRTREWIFHDGVVEFNLKELVRAYISISGNCEYCSNQGIGQTIMEDDKYINDLLNYAQSEDYTEREKIALEFTDAVMWYPAEADDRLWRRLYSVFTEQEIVELGYWIGFTDGGQRFLKTLGVHQGDLEYMP